MLFVQGHKFSYPLSYVIEHRDYPRIVRIYRVSEEQGYARIMWVTITQTVLEENVLRSSEKKEFECPPYNKHTFYYFCFFFFYKQTRIPCGFRCDEAAHVNPAERIGHESDPEIRA